jgi:metal-responsive CopG/Arc/MetJ family transcriptional regulator
MKTIAITIDEPTLRHIDELTGKNAHWKSRSQIVREAIQVFVARVASAAEEEREREIFRRHRARLHRQASALVKEQAKP